MIFDFMRESFPASGKPLIIVLRTHADSIAYAKRPASLAGFALCEVALMPVFSGCLQPRNELANFGICQSRDSGLYDSINLRIWPTDGTSAELYWLRKRPIFNFVVGS